MSKQILKACKELIDDEKRVAPTSFLTKHASKFCLEARNALSDEQSKQLVVYTTEKITLKVQL